MICDIFYWAGDLFDMLLPMLSIYQEYVRNHHYSLQVSVIFKSLAANEKLLLKLLTPKVCCR